MPFDPHLPCRTMNGREVEILAVLPNGKVTRDGESIVALVHGFDGATFETYMPDGRFDPKRVSTWDLVNVPVPVVTADQLAAMNEGERKQFVAQTAGRIRAVVEG